MTGGKSPSRASARSFGLKENLLYRYAVEGLRLSIPDAVAARLESILTVGRDSLLHLRSTETSILPDDGYDRDVDLRKDVDRSALKELQSRQGRRPETPTLRRSVYTLVFAALFPSASPPTKCA
jgi:hypothetical protein